MVGLIFPVAVLVPVRAQRFVIAPMDCRNYSLIGSNEYPDDSKEFILSQGSTSQV